MLQIERVKLELDEEESLLGRKAAAILRENREKLDRLARFLYERETITGEEFMELLNA